MTIILLANTHASMLFPYTTLFRSEGKPGCARGKAGDHAEMRILLDLERGFSPAPLDCPPERVQRAHAGISSPREHELPCAAGRDHLIVDQVGREAGQGEVATPLADDLVTGGEADEVSEAFDDDGVAGVHEARDG